MVALGICTYASTEIDRPQCIAKFNHLIEDGSVFNALRLETFTMLFNTYNEEPKVEPTVGRTNKFISGYWENWKGAINPGSSEVAHPSYYLNDIKHFNHVYYSFLTLEQHPNPDAPEKKNWDGLHIYESMTQAPI